MALRSWLCCTSAVVAFHVSTANAQTVSPAVVQGGGTDASQAPSSVGEVIVTAQRRESRLQDVPQAITAFDAKALQRLSIQNSEDLVRNTPGLTFTPVGPGESNLGMRGLDTALGLTSTVAVYVNDTPFDFRTDLRDGSPSVEVFDLDRIEVLRGPQGTLFGSSSLGGTIRYITNQPNPNAFAYAAEGGLSDNDEGGVGYAGKAMLNIPMAANAALRLVGTYEEDGGYIDRYAATQTGTASTSSTDPLVKHNANSDQIYSLRATGLLNVNAGLKITPSVSFQRIHADGPLTSQTNLPLYGRASFIGAEPSATNLFIANLAIEQKLSFATLTSSTSYLHKSSNATVDYSYLSQRFFGEFDPIAALNPSTASTVVQELRLVSPSQQRFRWLTGFYFSHTDQTEGEIFTGQGFADLVGQIAGLSGSSNGSTAYDFEQKTNDQQIAGFGEVNYDLTSKLELVGGLRVYNLANGVSNTCVDSGGNAILCTPNQSEIRGSVTSYSPRLTINYKLTPNALVYATASKGFRPGGANTPNPAGLGCSLTPPGLFQPDTVWNYELGAKTQTRDHRYTLNGTVYRIDHSGVQSAITDPVCGTITYFNAGDARTYGTEIEASAHPIEMLNVGGSVTYDSSSFVKVPTALGTAAGFAAGNPVPETPRLKLSLYAELRKANVYKDWDGFVRVNSSYVDRTPYSSSSRVSSGLYRSDYDITDFQMGADRGGYEVDFYVRNAFQSHAILGINTDPIETNPAGFSERTYTAPRTFGVTFRVKG